MSADDVLAMLRRHYLPEGRPQSGLLVEEIEAPDGRRRADALWVPLTTSGGNEIVGHEVKVSRADVAAELADLTKAESWMKYCTRWWLTVSDPALVEGFDIPETWGVMSPPSGRRTRSMTVLRQAPRLHPVDSALAYRRVLAKNHFGTNGRVEQLKRDLEYARRDGERKQEQIEQLRVTGADQHQTPTTKLVLDVVRKVEAAAHDWNGGRYFAVGQDVTADDVANAVIDLGNLRRIDHDLRNQVRYTVERLRSAADPVGRLADDIQKALSGGAA